ncbi:GNAT family N-acetyltransferase [Spirochaeta dissipatitropha]
MILRRSPWQLLSRREYAILAELLGNLHEWEYSALTDRLLRPLTSSQVWIHSSSRDSLPEGIILQEKSGYTFPWFTAGFRNNPDASLPELNYSPATIMGMDANLRFYLHAAGIHPREYIPYHLMHRAPTPLRLVIPPGFQLLPLDPSHFSLILPLERGYQREEVLLPGHMLHEETVARNLRYMLKRHIGYGVFHEGHFLAKAHTNARGLNCNQIGGVYTMPEWRSQGLAGLALKGLMKALRADRYNISLFVKPGNISGAALYRKLGFSRAGGYAIAYV